MLKLISHPIAMLSEIPTRMICSTILSSKAICSGIAVFMHEMTEKLIESVLTVFAQKSFAVFCDKLQIGNSPSPCTVKQLIILNPHTGQPLVEEHGSKDGSTWKNFTKRTVLPFSVQAGSSFAFSQIGNWLSITIAPDCFKDEHSLSNMGVEATFGMLGSYVGEKTFNHVKDNWVERTGNTASNSHVKAT